MGFNFNHITSFRTPAKEREPTVPEPIFYALDVEKSLGVGATWALSVCFVAFFKKFETVTPAYFAYVDNSERIVKGVEYSSIINQATISGIHPNVVKDDLLKIFCGKTVWLHQAQNDIECLDITMDELKANKIAIMDTADHFCRNNESAFLKDIVYATFKDKNHRPMINQEFSDDYVAFGGHNAEMDARFTAKLAYKIVQVHQLPTFEDIKGVIKDALDDGLIYRNKGSFSNKIPKLD